MGVNNFKKERKKAALLSAMVVIVLLVLFFIMPNRININQQVDKENNKEFVGVGGYGIPETSTVAGQEIYYANAKFYDIYSDAQVENSLPDGTPGQIYENLYVGYFGHWNRKILATYKYGDESLSPAVYPMYASDAVYNSYIEPNYNGIFIGPNDEDNIVSNFWSGAVTGLFSFTAKQGLIHNRLMKVNGEGFLATYNSKNGKSAILPYFDKEFLENNTHGEAYNNVALGKFYGNAGFPLRVTDVDGMKYYEFDSEQDVARFDENGKLQYIGYNQEDEFVSSYEAGVSFLPFNNPTDEFIRINYVFNGKIDLPVYIPEGGTVNGNDIIFEFSGDDDVFVFLDGHLVLDLGGSHGIVSGTVNFAKQVSEVSKVANNDAVFSSRVNFPPTDATSVNIDSLGEIPAFYTNVQASFSNELKELLKDESKEHILTVFYMERAKGSSNLRLKTNLLIDDDLEDYSEYENGVEQDEITPVEYNVKLHTVGGTIALGKNVTKYIKNIGVELPVEEDVTRAGYKFMGWYSDSAYTGKAVTSISEHATGDKEYWAKWEEEIVLKEATDSNINLSKSVNWTTIDGESRDNEGNPYVNTNFEIDLTNADLSKFNGTTTGNGNMDVILLMDFSDSLNREAAEKEKQAAHAFIDTLFSKYSNVRLGIAGFDDEVTQMVRLDEQYKVSNVPELKNMITNTMNSCNFDGGTNIQGALVWAQRQLAKSDAEKKIIVLLTDGQPSVREISDGMKDVIEITDPTLRDYLYDDWDENSPNANYIYDGLSDLVSKQAEYAKNNVPGLAVITVGFNLENMNNQTHIARAEQLLTSIASEDNNGNKMAFFAETTNDSSVLDDLVNVMGNISLDVKTDFSPKLVDYVPQEYEVLENTIVLGDNRIKYSIEQGKIVFDFSDVVLKNEKYTITFKSKLDIASSLDTIIANKGELYTNGTTIDTSSNSQGSAYLNFGNSIISLQSPILEYDLSNNVTLHTNGGVILLGKEVTSYTTGIGVILPGEADMSRDGHAFEGWYEDENFVGEPVKSILPTDTGDKEFYAKWVKNGNIKYTKSAEWSDFYENKTDEDGNPYVKTSFEVDLSEVNLMDFSQTSNIKGTSDIVVVLDFSYSMVTDCGMIDENGNHLTGVDIQRDETKKLVDKILVNIPNARFSIAGFADTMWPIVSLENDRETIFKKLDEVCAQRLNADHVRGTNIQNALVWTYRELANSTADEKVLFMLTDGLPSNSKSSVTSINGTPITAYQQDVLSGDDVLRTDSLFYIQREKNYTWHDYDSLIGETLMPESLQKLTLAQADYLKEKINGMRIVSVGVNLLNVKNNGSEQYNRLFNVGDNIMNHMATLDSHGKKMYYLTEISSETLGTEYLGDIFFECTKEVGGSSVANSSNVLKLVDYIPAEFSIIEETIEISDTGIKHTITEDGIEFDFSNIVLNNEKYTITFKTKLDIKASIDIIKANDSKLYTNGKTIDVTTDSKGSAYLLIGEEDRLDLESPILEYNQSYNVILHTNGGTFLEGKEVTGYSYGEVVMLPTKDDIFMKDSEFVGWYDNELLQGTPILSITETDIGDKEYWAKWDAVIEKTEGEITLTKSASWTTLNGEYTDENGNPYAKIEFQVDLSKANIMTENSTGTSAMTTDIVLVLDFSSSMDKKASGATQKGLDIEIEAAIEFLDTIMKDRNDTRVAVAGFADTIWEMVSLDDSISGNLEAIKKEVLKVYQDRGKTSNVRGTDIQNSLVWVQNQFANSKADNKIVAFLSDGAPSTAGGSHGSYGASKDETGDKINTSHKFYKNNASKIESLVVNTLYPGKDIQRYTLLQSLYLKELNPGIHVISLGLNMEALSSSSEKKMGTNVMKNLATYNKDGELMYYETSTDASQSAMFIRDMFKDVAEEVQKIQNKLKVVDTVPKEYEILGDTIQCEENVKIFIDEATGQLSFDFADVELENKVYIITFYIKLDVSKVPEDYRETYETLSTNGTTLDPGDDSTGSSFIEFGDQKIELESPEIVSQFSYKVSLHPEGGTILDGANVTTYKSGVGTKLPTHEEIFKPGYVFKGWYDNSIYRGDPVLFIPSSSIGDKEYWAKWEETSIINVTKSAEWSSIRGNSTDVDGNPYAEIKFDIDLTKMKLDQHISKSDESTDVVVLLDYSSNLWSSYGQRTHLKEAAKLLIENVLHTTDNSRVALGLYGETVDGIVNLEDSISNDPIQIGQLLETKHSEYYADYQATGGKKSNMQSAIIWAQRELMNHSKANKKVIVVFSDDEPAMCNPSDIYSGSDVIDVYGDINSQEKTDIVQQRINRQTIAQMNKAKELIEGLDVITVGYNIMAPTYESYERTRKVLIDMATVNDKNEKMYYEVSMMTPVNLIEPQLIDVPDETGKITVASAKPEDDIILEEYIRDNETLIDYITGDITFDISLDLSFKLVDLIPSEYSLLTDTIYKNDACISTLISGNKVTFKFPCDELEEKIYTITFKTVLYTHKISNDVIKDIDTIYTNGNTIDSRRNSLGSSYFECGALDTIQLKSPTLKLSKNSDVVLHTNGGVIAIGKDITSYREGIGVILPTEHDIHRDGMTFLGWYDNIFLQGEPVTRITTRDRGPKEYWAKWKLDGYNVVLHPKGGTFEEGAEVTGYVFGVTKELPTSEGIYRVGYDFAGWYDNEDLLGNAITEIGPTEEGDKQYWAKWTPITNGRLDEKKLVYTVAGYADLYATDLIDVTINGEGNHPIQAYLTRTDSATSKKLSEVATYYPGEDTYIQVSQSILLEIVKSTDPYYVYLQVVRDGVVTTTRIEMKYCTSFLMH